MGPLNAKTMFFIKKRCVPKPHSPCQYFFSMSSNYGFPLTLARFVVTTLPTDPVCINLRADGEKHHGRVSCLLWSRISTRCNAMCILQLKADPKYL